MSYTKKLLFPILFLFSFTIKAQTFSFDSIKVDSKTKLAAFYPYLINHPLDTQYNEFNFLLEDSTLISEALKGIKLGEERSNYMEMPSVNLFLIQNNIRIEHFRLNLKDKSIMINGHTYYANFENIIALHKRHHMVLQRIDSIFKSKESYELYEAKAIENKNLLFYYSPTFDDGGTVEIIFPHNKKFPWTTDVFNYIDAMMKPLAGKDEYDVSYTPEENVSTADCQSFFIEIFCNKKLGDKIKTKDATKHPWKPSIKEGTFFYKK